MSAWATGAWERAGTWRAGTAGRSARARRGGIGTRRRWGKHGRQPAQALYRRGGLREPLEGGGSALCDPAVDVAAYAQARGRAGFRAARAHGAGREPHRGRLPLLRGMQADRRADGAPARPLPRGGRRRAGHHPPGLLLHLLARTLLALRARLLAQQRGGAGGVRGRGRAPAGRPAHRRVRRAGRRGARRAGLRL